MPSYDATDKPSAAPKSNKATAEEMIRTEQNAQGRACDVCHILEPERQDPIVDFLLDERTRYTNECCPDL